MTKMPRLRTFENTLTAILMICTTKSVFPLTVDNRLVSAKNECFDRITLGAMLPFEKAFRNVDTNSLTNCQELCVQEGEKCHTIAFGVHVRGNGTCQLSSEIIDGSVTRPAGTIFDPDFDLYARKQNCFMVLSNTNEVTSTSVGRLPEDVRPGSSMSPLPFGPVRPTNGLPESQPPSTVTTLSDPEDGRFSPRPSNRYPPETTYPERDNRYPTTEYGTQFSTNGNDRYPSTDYNGRPSSANDAKDDGYSRPSDPSYPTRRPPGSYPLYDRNQDNDYRNRDKIYFSHDIYPLYKYPMLYEQNYPSPNDQSSYPGVYAQNVPTVYDRYKPVTRPQDQPFTTPRPMYGLGYGTGFSYGTPTNYGTTSKPNIEYNQPSPSYGYRPSDSHGSNRPDYNQNGNRYQPRPEYPSQEQPQYGTSTSVQPVDGDYIHRPDPPYNSDGNSNFNGIPNNNYTPGQQSPPKVDYPSNPAHSVPYRPRPENGHSAHEGNYHRMSGEPIETYFNPDDYFEVRWTTKPGTAFQETGGYNSGKNHGNRYPDIVKYRACFRRVLAGKRVAPHWVRRTLPSCERVEDCMHECGHEKRFTCEGFNYRLDPSGHGQGDCELIEVPLSQMDLYSSMQSRDANLQRHPDYDYYERDRNGPSSCRQKCAECGVKPISSPPIYYKPSYDKHSYIEEHYSPPSSSGFSGSGSGPYRPADTAIDKYRPPAHTYDSRPPPDYPSYDFSSHSYYDGGYSKPSYGVDRYDITRPDDRPSHWEIQVPSSYGGNFGSQDFVDRQDHFRPPYRPGSDYSPYRPHHELEHYPVPPSGSSHPYLDKDRSGYSHRKPARFIPYLIGTETDWGSYGGSYGGGSHNKASEYWGLRNEHRRKDSNNFNYFELGNRDRVVPLRDNDILSYPGSKYGHKDELPPDDRPDYGNQWTRRPGPDECSVKSSEGFRIHKGAVRIAYTAPTVTECEKLCISEDKFICHTYSYRYSTIARENCQLCDRPIHLLDHYVDIEPDRDFDIYAVTEDHKSCRPPSGGDTAVSDPRNNAQCFFRAIDATRFFKTIVRDSLNVRSIGECELECIKSSKFTCRAFSFRYGQRTPGGIIDNCLLSDWPVRDMDKERHLVLDPSFDVFERASYGHGCEIQPIVDDKHKKLCYLGYGSPAKLLTTAIKKVISVPTELECKKECIRYRENTSFKCYSFSFGSHASTFNCEMSDLDQTELKLNVHYAHIHDRDYWLFAWNPFDWTCRDKVLTIGGTRVNNDRRMDIFREPGEVTWRHYTVSGKPCRVGSECAKNLVTGFYSCEIDGGEIGSWDYCCKADYPCGYSQGFEYPWCFVGDEPDQWRKCSDRYFPGNHTQLLSSATSPVKDKKKHQHYQTPPRPGGLQSLTDFTAARLWPVTYLYSEGPPNSTELSNFVDCNKETC